MSKSENDFYYDVISAIREDSEWQEMMDIIEQNPTGDPKLWVDHGRGHVERVLAYAQSILSDIRFGFCDQVKTPRLAEIVILLHDIGLSTDNHDHHAATSAKMADAYLRRSALSPEDRQLVVHAIAQHSSGEGIESWLDAAVLLSDKLDVTKERFKNDLTLEDRYVGELIREFRKLERVEFKLEERFDELCARLCYWTTDGEFDVDRLRQWPKCISVPKKVALDFLGCVDFALVVNDTLVDTKKLLSP